MDYTLNPIDHNMGRFWQPQTQETTERIHTENFPKSGLPTGELKEILGKNNESESQICQNCRESFSSELEICPFCGYSLAENIRIQQERKLITRNNLYNLCYWYWNMRTA